MRAWSREQPLVAELQPVQLSALHYLARCNRYSDTPLGVTEYLGLTKGTVSQSLKVLEGRGLISKLPDARDRRSVHRYARVTGKPGVCFIITGPGMTNILTAMAQAYADSIPMLVISSVNERARLAHGNGYLHELPNQRNLVGNVCAFSHTLTAQPPSAPTPSNSSRSQAVFMATIPASPDRSPTSASAPCRPAQRHGGNDRPPSHALPANVPPSASPVSHRTP